MRPLRDSSQTALAFPAQKGPILQRFCSGCALWSLLGEAGSSCTAAVRRLTPPFGHPSPSTADGEGPEAMGGSGPANYDRASYDPPAVLGEPSCPRRQCAPGSRIG